MDEVGDGGVMVVDSTFQEKSITVPLGTTIIWTASANLPHTATSDDNIFDSGTMRDGDVFTFTFEEAGLGPAPFAAMMLADMGAEVLRIDRPWEIRSSSPIESSKDVLNRGRMSVGIDLKNSHGVEVVFELLKTADALIEGYRPGVMERLGLGPDICLEKNPRLVYGRMTGWGQDGPLAHAAGHDINYIALAGVLNAQVSSRSIPQRDSPRP